MYWEILSQWQYLLIHSLGNRECVRSGDIWWPTLQLIQAVPPGDHICNATHANSGAIWWPIFKLMQMVPECCPSHGVNFWVNCGNVFYIPHHAVTLNMGKHCPLATSLFMGSFPQFWVLLTSTDFLLTSTGFFWLLLTFYWLLLAFLRLGQFRNSYYDSYFASRQTFMGHSVENTISIEENQIYQHQQHQTFWTFTIKHLTFDI